MLIPMMCKLFKFIANYRIETEVQALYMKSVVYLQNTTQINSCTTVTGIVSNIAKTIRSFGCDSMNHTLQHILLTYHCGESEEAFGHQQYLHDLYPVHMNCYYQRNLLDLTN
jgi:hypothetical protein